MIISSELPSVCQRQLVALENRMAALQKFAVTEEDKRVVFSAAELQEPARILALARELPTKGKYLYAIEASNPVAVLNDYTAYRLSQEGNIGYVSRCNTTRASNILYVGSSNGLRERFKMHLGYFDDRMRTYGLKLKKWLSGSAGQLQFYYYSLPEVDQGTLQQLEDGLWDALQPCFGKKGSN